MDACSRNNEIKYCSTILVGYCLFMLVFYSGAMLVSPIAIVICVIAVLVDCRGERKVVDDGVGVKGVLFGVLIWGVFEIVIVLLSSEYNNLEDSQSQYRSAFFYFSLLVLTLREVILLGYMLLTK